MIAYAVADLHGFFPQIEECDLLLIGGDLINRFAHSELYRQLTWFNINFRRWIEEIPAKQILVTAGNHDAVLQERFWDVVNQHIPRCKFLIDDWTEVLDGETKFKVYGYPWQRINGDWAFNADDNLRKERAALIPDDTDIVLAHSPPYQILDIGAKNEHIGCQFLADRIKQIKPYAVVFGHSHYQGHKEVKIDETLYVNACVVNTAYQLTHKPVRIDLWK